MALSAAVDTSFLLSAAADRQSCKSGARPRPGKQASSFSPSFLRSVAPRFAGLSSALILRFPPPNFVRQLSTKARRNCCNIGVAQIVAASWSNSSPAFETPRSAASEDAAVAAEDATLVSGGASQSTPVESPFPLTGEAKASAAVAKAAASLNSDGSLAVHAGERFGRRTATDAITTPVVNTSAYWFNNSDELIDFKEKRHASFEYGRYGNPTTQALEEKMSALERAESTLFVSSGMYASVASYAVGSGPFWWAHCDHHRLS
ncbi:unnamed protein product [Musa acuminata subsp. malaccensis]|uniref:(wild Malaysian banana) hypothetical protein n=1 Tax=Musa acuminata subsp. malaccensis TaxID=214687 RepID=A0A8D7FSJ7_MUSAM|nr:unnamed protein product [Musa acuminata subsp. malaccensis]